MNKLEDLRLITKREARLLFDALHRYIFNKEDGLMHKKPYSNPDLVEANQLYQDLKGFIGDPNYD